MAYKKDVDDPRESPSFELMDLLRRAGAVLSYNDPHVPRLPKMRHHQVDDMTSQELTPQFLASQDCVLIATDHSDYKYDDIVRLRAAGDRHPQRHQERARAPREDRQDVARRLARCAFVVLGKNGTRSLIGSGAAFACWAVSVSGCHLCRLSSHLA